MAYSIKWSDGNAVAVDSTFRWSDGSPYPYHLTELAAYSLACASGSVSLSGTAVGLKATRKLATASGSLGLSGTAVTLKVARKAATAALSGSPIEFHLTRKLNADAGDIALSGTALTFVEIEKLSILLGSGSFRLKGEGLGGYKDTGASGDWKDWKNQKPWAVEWADKWGYLNNPAWMRPSAPVNYTGNEGNEPQAWTVVHKNKWGYLNNPRWKELADD